MQVTDSRSKGGQIEVKVGNVLCQIINSVNVKIMTGNGNCRGGNKRSHDLEEAQLQAFEETTK